MRFVGVELLHQLTRHGDDVRDGEFSAVRVQDLDKAAHVRAFELVRQVNGERDRGDGVLHGGIAVTNAHGEAQAANADAIDGQAAVVAFVLRVSEGGHGQGRK
jgi:hypothetical protein